MRIDLRSVLKQAFLLVAVFYSLSAARADESKPAPARPIALFMGSSTIDYWKTLASDFPDYKTVNVGVAGTRYTYLIEHTDQWLKDVHPDLIVVYSGDNDVAWGASPATVAANFETLLKSIRAVRPDVPVIVISIKPSYSLWRQFKINRIAETNGFLEAAAKKDPNTRFVDVFSKMLNERGRPNGGLFGLDGIHMNESGYSIWKDVLTPVLNQAAKVNWPHLAPAAKPQ